MKCVDCKKDFDITDEDKSFCEKMKVPLIRTCFECSFKNRMIFRNERTLYKRKCDAPGHGEEILSVYAPDSNVTVYDNKYWWGDEWSAFDYGKEYDFSRPFFEQFKGLIHDVPWPNLMNWNSVNSDYCNCTADAKNCYLVFGGDFSEDCSYATFNMHSRNSQDLYLVNKMDLSYECTDSEECYKVRFARHAKSCSDSMFLYDCVNCTNCIGCIGLRNKSYCIFNTQYTKEEYETKVQELRLNTRSGLQEMQKDFSDFCLRYPHRFAYVIRSVSSTGENVMGAKNVVNGFDIEGPAEDCKDVTIAGWDIKDARSASHTGHGSELIWNSWGVFSGCRNLRFCIYQNASIDCTYSYNCPTGSNLFGCVGLRNGNYVILNKQYTKEEYNELVPKIIAHMNEMPYVDTKGKEYRFGDFFPKELSPFGYNETIAFDSYSLSKEEALKQGFSWKDREVRSYQTTLDKDSLPETSKEVDESILKEIVACEHAGNCNDSCSMAFRIIPQELEFYKRLDLPMPTLCPSCRHYARIRSRNPMQLWDGACHCKGEESSNGLYRNTRIHDHGESPCTEVFKTAYSPDRKEILYCESCYQREIL